MRQQLEAGAVEATSDDDLDLVERCKAGDLEAFDQLVLKYQDRVYSYACRMLRNPETAREVTQDIFLRAYRYIKSFRGDSKFGTWLFTVASSTCKNALAYHGLRARHAANLYVENDEGQELSLMEKIPDNSHAPEQGAERAELQRVVRNTIAELPEHYRQVVTLKDINGFSYEEISKIVGCRTGTVKSRLARARLMLRENLTQAGIMGPEGM
ncbi:sigma-70 family RNA polymerase sigma factor [bacterium]